VIEEPRALSLMQEAVSDLRQGGLIDRAFDVTRETVLLGAGSPLDSIGFVTFVTELEDRLGREVGNEVPLLFNEIHDFNVNNPHLSAGTLARYIATRTAQA
jgi:acyl carrier protein